MEETALAAWIRQRLEERGMSQRDFAREANIPQASVSCILSKGHIPGYEMLQKIAAYFDVSIFFIYKLAGYLPPGVDVENADPAAVAALEDAARMLSGLPPAVRERFLMGLRTMIAAFTDSESVHAE